jgi:hypothetical protein
VGHDGRVKRTRKCRVVSKDSVSVSATIIANAPFKAGDGNESFLCGACDDGVVMIGFDFTRPPEYFKNKFGCFVICKECAAYNQVSAPRIP